MFPENINSTSEDIRRRCSLPALSTITSRDHVAGDICEDRRLPPLQHVVPYPPGPFNNPFAPILSAPSPPCSQDSFPLKSSWSAMDHFVAPPSPAVSAAGSWQDSFTTSQKPTEWPCDISSSEMMALICPAEINRKPPLQQLCGKKRKSSLMSDGDLDDQREKHRIAEGNRRKNLSQLHRELDSRIHDYFLERAGWNPAKSLPQSKEHIVLAAIFLIDFMRNLILQMMKQENASAASQLPQKLQPQIRCMELQQQVSTLQQERQAAQEQMKTLKQQNDDLAERNRALEFQLKSYELMFRTTPKSESTSPRPLSTIPENKKQCNNMLPGLRVLCDGIASITSDAAHPLLGTSFSRNTSSMTTAPSSPAYLSYSQSGNTISRRESLASTSTP